VDYGGEDTKKIGIGKASGRFFVTAVRRAVTTTGVDVPVLYTAVITKASDVPALRSAVTTTCVDVPALYTAVTTTAVGGLNG
jgi:hypothetical protein